MTAQSKAYLELSGNGVSFSPFLRKLFFSTMPSGLMLSESNEIFFNHKLPRHVLRYYGKKNKNVLRYLLVH